MEKKEESDEELGELFELSECYFPEKKTIDISLENAANYCNYYSERSIASFAGCIRFGILTHLLCLGNSVIGFEKKTVHEWPIFSLKKAIKGIEECFLYLFNDEKKDFEIEICSHPKSEKIKAYVLNSKRTISFINFTQGQIVNIESFDDIKLFRNFVDCLKNVLFSVTAPCAFLQTTSQSFFEKLLSKRKDQVNKLFQLWKKNKKLRILWNAAAEQLKLEEPNASRQSISFLYNFWKTNLEMIENVYVLNCMLNKK